MLPKRYRLPLRTEFHRIKKQGRLIPGQLFSLLVVQPQEAGDQPPRFAFIVSKKIHSQATKRNRARRLLREGVRSLVLQIQPGVEGIFLARKAIVQADLNQVKTELAKIFRQASLIK